MALINVDAGSVVKGISDAIDHFFPSPEEKAKAQAMLDQIAQQPGQLQIEVNKIEAANSSLFVAGWRPAVGWICAFGLAYSYILQPLAVFTMNALGKPTPPPVLDLGSLFNLLLAMLGMAGLRTFEKNNGVQGNH